MDFASLMKMAAKNETKAKNKLSEQRRQQQERRQKEKNVLPASSFYDSIELKRTSTKRKEAKTQREGNRDVVVSEKKKAVSRIKAVQKKAAVPVAAAATSSIKKGERAAKKTTTNADNDDNDPSRKSLNFSQLMELASKQPAMTSNGRQETTKTKDAEKVRRKSDDPRTFSSSAPKRKATLVSETLNKGFSTATSSSSSSSGGNERRQRVSMTTLPWRRTVPRRRESNYYDDDDDDDDDDDGFIEKGGEEFDYSSIIRDLSGYDKSKYRFEDPRTDNMEASYREIVQEEKRSARLARLEDLEEERKEREREKRKLAAAAAAKKKRKTKEAYLEPSFLS
ncbi:protein SPT2 homolog [Oscarella lobularis]|uniref:protein SPT2 homolog n=1 Tax=Oscarella lobularis TaxID=121494 RepID=UPI0033132979